MKMMPDLTLMLVLTKMHYPRMVSTKRPHFLFAGLRYTWKNFKVRRSEKIDPEPKLSFFYFPKSKC